MSILENKIKEMLDLAEEFEKKILLSFNQEKSEHMTIYYSKKKMSNMKEIMLNGKGIKEMGL